MISPLHLVSFVAFRSAKVASILRLCSIEATFAERKATISFRLASLIIALVGIGCDHTPQPPPRAAQAAAQVPEESTSTEPPKDAYPRTVTDGLKRSVTLVRQPKRIVSLAPKNTEELFAIGAGAHVVGVTSYCNYPAEATNREQIGGFSSKSISLEKIVSLHPDLVISAGTFHAPVIAELERLNIPVVALAAESFEDLYSELRMLGTLIGHEREANELVEGMQGRVRRVQEIAERIPMQDRVSVFYMTWDEPLAAAGPASYAGQMIELCGGVNIISDASARYPQISQELLLDRDPQVIIAAAMTTNRWSAESLRQKTGWQNLTALRNGRLYLLEGDVISRCGPRLVEVLELMAHSIYPAHFHEPTGTTAVATKEKSEPSP